MSKYISVVDTRGVRHKLDLSLFQYSFRVQTTNSWTLVFADKERVVVSKVRADMVENMARGYRVRVMSKVMKGERD